MFTPYRPKTLSDVKETHSIEAFNDVIQNLMILMHDYELSCHAKILDCMGIDALLNLSTSRSRFMDLT